MLKEKFLNAYNYSFITIKLKAYFFLLINFILILLHLVLILFSLFQSYDNQYLIIVLQLMLIIIHVSCIILLKKNRYLVATNLLIWIYTVAWFGGAFIKTEAFVQTGTNGFFFLIFIIIGMAGLFCTRRILTAVTVLFLIGVASLFIFLNFESRSGIFILVRSQAVYIYITIAAIYSIFYLIQKISESSISTAEDEIDKNLNIMKALEEKIHDRTEQLLYQKNELKNRNDEFERELLMACKIQKALIPSENPADYIYSSYKPMQIVGGDFYDFLRFRNSDRIGIFLSDVTGHGVPAAFITSMIKSFILQAGARREDPAALLSYLNDLLYNQTANNFITAFYGIFDPGTRHFTYASAGHNAPYLIFKDTIEFLPLNQSIPLAILNSKDIEEMDDVILNNEFDIPLNCKMLLYTDGILEERNSDDVQFQDGPFEDALLESRDMGKNLFIENLYKRLADYTGLENFNDDICLIYLDI